MRNMFKKLNKISSLTLRVKSPLSWLLSSSRKITQAPLLSDDEILNLLHRSQIKSINKQSQDISFRQVGDRRSSYRGYGIDYEESRRYQSGDDPRYMNWQLSARTGQHFMKVFREEKQAGVFIVIDKRLSMRFGTKDRLKVTQAVRAAAIAAFSALNNNFSVSALIIEQQLNWFTETQNKQRVFNFIQQAAKATAPIFETNFKQEQSLHHSLKLLNEALIHKSGSIIYLISDFDDLNDKSQPVLLELAARHQLNAIKITDIAEIKLPDTGVINLKSANNQDKIPFDSYSKKQKEQFEAMTNEYLNNKKSLFQNLAIPYQEILTSCENIAENIRV